jgi:hypothetical protein
VGGEVDFFGSVASLVRNVLKAAHSLGATEATGFIDRMRAGFDHFSAPTLIVQSGRDLTANEFRAISGGDPGWRRALARSSVDVLDMAGADHTFSRAGDLADFNGKCSRWLEEHFGGATCR